MGKLEQLLDPYGIEIFEKPRHNGVMSVIFPIMEYYDENGFPWYTPTGEPPYIVYNPSRMKELALDLGMGFEEVLYFAAAHEVGHVLQKEDGVFFGSEFQVEEDAWSRAEKLVGPIPEELRARALKSYVEEV